MELDKTIKSLLNELNSQNEKGLVVTRSLADNIEFARIWEQPVSEFIDNSFFDLYLIKEQKNYIGTFTELETGLYAYMSLPFRKKGIMTEALKKVILPHLLQRKPVLRTFLGKTSNERQYTANKKLAMSVGFSVLTEDNAGCRLIMDASSLKERVFINGINRSMHEGRKKVLKNRIYFTATLLSTVQTELEFTCGMSAYTEELNDFINLLNVQATKLDSAWLGK